MNFLVSSITTGARATLRNLDTLTQISLEAFRVSLGSYFLEAVVRYSSAIIAVSREWQSSKTARSFLPSWFCCLYFFNFWSDNFRLLLLDWSRRLLLSLRDLFDLCLLLLLSFLILFLFIFGRNLRQDRLFNWSCWFLYFFLFELLLDHLILSLITRLTYYFLWKPCEVFTSSLILSITLIITA